MKTITLTALILTGAFIGSFNCVKTYADEVCKEVDSEGNPSFIDCDAAGNTAKKIKIQETTIVSPEEYLIDLPASENKKEASAGDSSDNKSKQTKLIQARKELEEAKQVREGDRQKTKTGSRLKESYFERIKRAERKVESLK